MRELRIARGLTQEQVAEKAGLDDKHLQTIEAGTSNVTMASLVGITRCLGVTLSELFKGV